MRTHFIQVDEDEMSEWIVLWFGLALICCMDTIIIDGYVYDTNGVNKMKHHSHRFFVLQ